MVKETLVEVMKKAGADLIELLRQKKIGIREAFWFYSSDEQRWTLTIATPFYEQRGRRKSYGEIEKVLQDDSELSKFLHLQDIRVTSPKKFGVIELGE